MSPPAPPSSSGQGDDSMGPLWLSAIVIAVAVGTWFLGHKYIVEGFFYFKSLEISGIQFFTNGLSDIKTYIFTVDPGNVSFFVSQYPNISMIDVASAVGYYLRYPVAVIMLLLAGILFKKSSVAKYKHTHDMRSLMHFELQNFPQIGAAVKQDLIHQNIDIGPWAMSIPPMRFAKQNKLLRENINKVEAYQLSKNQKFTVSVVRGRAHRIFVLQLGRRWQNVESLPIHIQALFVAFAARGLRDTQLSQSLLTHWARTYNDGKIDFSKVSALIKKYQEKELVVSVIEKHAYILTVMASMLEFAREDGVLSSADFMWLKPMDRKLWYMLNNVGRQTAFVEVAGPYAHWIAEKHLGKKLLTPMIDKAIDALDESIQGFIYDPNKEY